MTRTDVMASSRPQTLDATPLSRRSSSFLRALSAMAVVLALTLMLLAPGSAIASSTSGYNQEPNQPKTTTTKTSTGVSPSKEAKPAGETAPTATTPTATTAKASTLPFTGFDLRWDIGFGLLAMGAGFSILAMLRRRHNGR